MRNFEERLGEIRRRGEELKRKRRNRQKLLAACIPLVLCVGVCTLLLPDFKRAPAAGENASPAGLVQEQYMETQPATGAVLQVRQVRVEGHNLLRTHIETAQVEKIAALLSELTGRKQSYTYAPPIVDPADAPVHTGQDGILRENMGYVVTVVTGDGVQQYYLLGSMLKNMQTGTSCSLEEKDLFALKDALGIPLY